MNRRTFLAGIAAGPAAVIVPNCKRGPTNPNPPPATVAELDGWQRKVDELMETAGPQEPKPKIRLGTWPPMGHRCIDLHGSDPDPIMVGLVEPVERMAIRT